MRFEICVAAQIGDSDHVSRTLKFKRSVPPCKDKQEYFYIVLFYIIKILALESFFATHVVHVLHYKKPRLRE